MGSKFAVGSLKSGPTLWESHVSGVPVKWSKFLVGTPNNGPVCGSPIYREFQLSGGEYVKMCRNFERECKSGPHSSCPEIFNINREIAQGMAEEAQGSREMQCCCCCVHNTRCFIRKRFVRK